MPNQYYKKIKKIILIIIAIILLIAILLMSSCKKDEQIRPVAPSPALYQKVNVGIKTSHLHTLMYSWYKIDGKKTTIPIYATELEFDRVLKAGTVIHLHLKIDNLSLPVAYSTINVSVNDKPDTTWTQDFND